MMLLQNKSLAKHRQTQNQRRGVQCLTTKPQTLHSVVFFIHSKYVFFIKQNKNVQHCTCTSLKKREAVKV